MATSISNAGNSPNANHLLRNVLERVEDSVSFEPMKNAVVLNCGHSLNENTVLDLRKDPAHAYAPSVEPQLRVTTLALHLEVLLSTFL